MLLCICDRGKGETINRKEQEQWYEQEEMGRGIDDDDDMHHG